MELILVVSAVGTATTMFPILRKYNETIALWHVCFRFLEAIMITVGVISVLSLVTLSREYVAAGAADIASFQTSGIVHRFIPILGMTGAALVFLCALLVMFGVIDQVSALGGLLALPVAANEMSLAVWLLVKGFNESALASMSARTETNKLIATQI